MNWKQAFSIGVIPPGVWNGKGEPVAYLYNGIIAPALPAGSYKYAMMTNGNIDDPTPVLWVSTPVSDDSLPPYRKYDYVVLPETVHRYIVNGNNEWERDSYDLGDWAVNINPTIAYEPYWFNFDIDEEIKATDPIPVYE